MKWKHRLKELEELRKKYKGRRYRAPFPDLSIEQRTAPTSDRFAPTMCRRSLPEGANVYPVGSLHKSNPMLITPGMVSNNELKFLGGRKF